LLKVLLHYFERFETIYYFFGIFSLFIIVPLLICLHHLLSLLLYFDQAADVEREIDFVVVDMLLVYSHLENYAFDGVMSESAVHN
jgi:hypothetical protein